MPEEKPPPSLDELIAATRRRLEGLRLEAPDLSKLSAPSGVPAPELPPLKEEPKPLAQRALLGTLLDKVALEIEELKPPEERARARRAPRTPPAASPEEPPAPPEPADPPSAPRAAGAAAPIKIEDLPAPNRPWVHTSAVKRSWLERLGAWLRLR